MLLQVLQHLHRHHRVVQHDLCDLLRGGAVFVGAQPFQLGHGAREHR